VSDAGKCRAQILTGVLADAGVTHTDLKPEAIEGKDYDTLVGKLKLAAGVSLVVGHSNTLPEIISRLGAGTVAPISDNDFDRLYVVTKSAVQTSLVMLHFPGCAK
jgi:hypothetical protein